ncbi:hypothetical protein EU695_24960 [Salmonella enterica]|nr:hypothetical protein [Salmonella enterica]
MGFKFTVKCYVALVNMVIFRPGGVHVRNMEGITYAGQRPDIVSGQVGEVSLNAGGIRRAHSAATCWAA